MRVCPTCKTPYQNNITICPRDETPLSTLPQIIQKEVKVPKPIKPGSIVGNYQIVKKLGSGGMGAVYSASHLSLEKEFAIKILREDSAQNPKMLERFYREARSVAKIEHDHVIQISDFGCTAEGLTYLVMELLIGRSLEDLLKAEKKLPVARAVNIATQICSALSAAHQRKIIHRDLKPENIFLLSNKKDPDYVKVLDFGIAKVLDEESNTVSQVMGTPLYMAPETGAAIDERTDVYALGVIFYRMFTGVLPFEGSNVMDILYKHLVEEPRPLREHDPTLPAHIERAVLKALSKNKLERHPSMEAFSHALCTPDEDATRMRSLPKSLLGDGPDTLNENTWQEPSEPPTSIVIVTQDIIEQRDSTIPLHTGDVIVQLGALLAKPPIPPAFNEDTTTRAPAQIPSSELKTPPRPEKIFTLNTASSDLPTNQLPSRLTQDAALLEQSLLRLKAPNPTPIDGEVTPPPMPRARQRLWMGLVSFLLIWGVVVGGLLFSAAPNTKSDPVGAPHLPASMKRPTPEPVSKLNPQTAPTSKQAASTPASIPVITQTQPASLPIEKTNKLPKKPPIKPKGPKGNPNLD